MTIFTIKKLFVDIICWFIPSKDLRQKLRKRNQFYNHTNNKWVSNVKKEAKSVGIGLQVLGPAMVTKNTYIGDYIALNGIIIQGNGKVSIGSYTHIGRECLIVSQNHNYEGDAIPFDHTSILKDVEIGDFVWIGSRVMILPGTKIGEGAIIQGGSVVRGEIPPYAIAGGNPAKVFKYRDKEHFIQLKEEGKFLKPKYLI